LVYPAKAKDIFEAIETNFKIWGEVGKLLQLKGFTVGRNDEGAWIVRKDDLKTLEIVTSVAEKYGAKVGIDVAASQFYKKGKYVYYHLKKKFDSGDQLEFMKHLIKTYKLSYVEDPFHENDFASFAELRKSVSCLVVGDDLFATNLHRIMKGIDKESCNGVIIKPDQAGLVTRAIHAADVAKRGGLVPIVSHRSGETEDAFISDLAVALEAPLIKFGISGTERVAKVNRLIEIWNGIKNSKMRPQMAKLKF
jgi:enolase